jgi:predicted HicB family RNase H-like nuclease
MVFEFVDKIGRANRVRYIKALQPTYITVGKKDDDLKGKLKLLLGEAGFKEDSEAAIKRWIEMNVLKVISKSNRIRYINALQPTYVTDGKSNDALTAKLLSLLDEADFDKRDEIAIKNWIDTLKEPEPTLAKKPVKEPVKEVAAKEPVSAPVRRTRSTIKKGLVNADDIEGMKPTETKKPEAKPTPKPAPKREPSPEPEASDSDESDVDYNEDEDDGLVGVDEFIEKLAKESLLDDDDVKKNL